ncbi:SDR family oxidoreductase [Limibacter armeniacum]|uniref:SDR family oxidoreductase n=1 Tax=Limibacter armeniacum TaxID=466084 RepID=UPI002FE60D9B
MNLNLENKHALVCGSTQGIGKASAIELATLGATVTLLARNEDSLQQTVNELPTPSGQQHKYLCVDFQNPHFLQDKLNSYLDSVQTIHILVNNTGGPAPGPAHTATLDDFEKAFTMHLKCNQVLVQAVIQGMKVAHYGRIINIISTSVKQPIPGLGVSNTIRGAVANWSKTLASELGGFGITVNNVLPGTIKTGRLKAIVQSQSQKNNISEEEVQKRMEMEIPAGRFGEVEEIASVVAFLASPSAAYVNGINVPVDGGRTKSL